MSKHDQKTSKNVNPELTKKVQEVLITPLPELNDFWKIQLLHESEDEEGGILQFFKRKKLSAKELSTIRNDIQLSPGNTKVYIQKLLKKHEHDPVLIMLHAICSHEMIINASEMENKLEGIKHACQEAATGLYNNQISIYNCEQFFKIYFSFLNRLKREQIKAYSLIRHTLHMESHRKKLLLAIRYSEQLCEDEHRVTHIVNFLKKKLKTSKYTTNFDFRNITKAGQLIEQEKGKDEMEHGTANEEIAYIFSLSIAFARVPILEPLVDLILRFVPEGNLQLILRKLSIVSIKNLTRLKLAMTRSDPEAMRRLATEIFEENLAATKLLEGQALHQTYECDPFFNIAIIAELSNGLFNSDYYNAIVENAMQGMENVIRKDMSRKHIFTETAKMHTHKLIQFMKDTDEEEAWEDE